MSVLFDGLACDTTRSGPADPKQRDYARLHSVGDWLGAFYEEHGTFPGRLVGRQEQPHSWRVACVSHFDDRLAAEYDLSVEWDRQTNICLGRGASSVVPDLSDTAEPRACIFALFGEGGDQFRDAFLEENVKPVPVAFVAHVSTVFWNEPCDRVSTHLLPETVIVLEASLLPSNRLNFEVAEYQRIQFLKSVLP